MYRHTLTHTGTYIHVCMITDGRNVQSHTSSTCTCTCTVPFRYNEWVFYVRMQARLSLRATAFAHECVRLHPQMCSPLFTRLVCCGVKHIRMKAGMRSLESANVFITRIRYTLHLSSTVRLPYFYPSYGHT